MLGAKYRNAKTILLYSFLYFMANMSQGKQEISPLEKWYDAGKNDPKMGTSLRLLLGHALVAIFRNNRPDFSIFSPEKALSFVQRLVSIRKNCWTGFRKIAAGSTFAVM